MLTGMSTADFPFWVDKISRTRFPEVVSKAEGCRRTGGAKLEASLHNRRYWSPHCGERARYARREKRTTFLSRVSRVAPKTSMSAPITPVVQGKLRHTHNDPRVCQLK